MGRRIRYTLPVISTGLILAAIIAALLLAACSNPIDILEELTEEVKIANNKFLLINSIDPAKNTLDFNPGKRITIEFDRSIDSSTINTVNIVLTPEKPWDYTYNDSVKTLFLEPEPYLDPLVEYSVKLTSGLKGKDGSELQNDFIWIFATKVYPAGNIKINGDAVYLTTGDSTNVTLNVSYNDQVAGFRYSTDQDILTYTYGTPPILGNESTTDISFPLDTGQGEKAVYIQFKNNNNPVDWTGIKSDTIIRDSVVPVVEAGSNRSVNLSTYFPFTQNASASDATSGLESINWTWALTAGSIGDSITLANTTKEDVIVTAADNVEATFTLTMTVKDKAQWQTSDTMTVTVDRVAPPVPVIDDLNTTSSPSVDTGSITLAWSLVKEAASYLLLLNGEKWNETKDTKYTYYYDKDKNPFPYGPYTLGVLAYDDAGNPSSTASRTVYVSPKDILPLWGATGVLTESVKFDWPDYIIKRYTAYEYTFDLGFDPRMEKYKYYTTKESGFILPFSLDVGTTYYWRYTATTKVNRWTSPIYSFTTIKK